METWGKQSSILIIVVGNIFKLIWIFHESNWFTVHCDMPRYKCDFAEFPFMKIRIWMFQSPLMFLEYLLLKYKKPTWGISTTWAFRAFLSEVFGLLYNCNNYKMSPLVRLEQVKCPCLFQLQSLHRVPRIMSYALDALTHTYHISK